MLTEARYATILKLLTEKKVVTVTELAQLLDTSESTIRRDLTSLHNSGRLYKVYGGATAIDSRYTASEDDMRTKASLYTEEKTAIARMAAKMVERHDFVYLDAGSTTLQIIDFLTEKEATYVTNGLPHASRLVSLGFKVYILGGCLKATTEAVIGSTAVRSLEAYNFTKGFFGTNGISAQSGFSTPDTDEGIVKEEALKRCKQPYVLADQSKFNRITPFTFASLSSASIITWKLADLKYRDLTTVLENGTSAFREESQ